jgi:restriction system protein
MSVPSYDQLMKPTMDALRALGGSASGADILQHVLRALGLPQEIAEQPHLGRPGMTELEYRLHWARTYLKQYGLIANPLRGRWTLTEEGVASPEIRPLEIVRAVKAQISHEAIRSQAAASLSQPPANGVQRNEASRPLIPGQTYLSPTPNLPTYPAVRHFMRIIDGISYVLFRSMYNDLWEQRGNPQETTDWADPDQWIPQRLSGEEQKLALSIWRESSGTVNPRYLRGSWYLANKHELLQRNVDGILCITPRGHGFISQPSGQVVAEVDSDEGILMILRLVADKGPGRRGDFLQEYGEYCRTYTTFHADTVVKTSLYDRLKNLMDRGYVVGRGQSYEITDPGLGYLDAAAGQAPGRAAVTSKQSDLRKLAKDLQQEAREQLAHYLAKMDPFKFEGLIKLLLEEMGYDDVQTTSPTNDKGVDVVANIELGISSVREVLQVKRHKGNINRTVLDQLRGSLHRFNAVRGTVITTGHFSKGTQEAAFERGAAPITLIDGDKLLDLLVEHQIGVTKKAVEYHEFDSDKLSQFETEAGED